MAQILVVDARPAAAAALGRLLRRAGHDVHEDTQATSALRAATGQQFDVAVVDQLVPDMGGLAFVQRLRSLQPSCARILVTSVMNSALDDAWRCGTVSRTVRRPCSDTGLLQAVDVTLSERQSHREIARIQRMAAEEEERGLLQECFLGETLGIALQPIISAQNREVVAFEALLRSQHPIVHNPLMVLQTAERFDQLGRLADIVAQRAAWWLDRLPTYGKIFVNVHPEDFASADALEARLRGLSPDRIVLELTDSSRLPQVHGWEQSLIRVRAMGFPISIDNFGENYSALGILSALTPRYMKANASLTRGLDADPVKRQRILMLRRFAEACGAVLVAEGVETPAEAGALIDVGVPLMQGYLFGRPSSDLSEVCGWLEAHGPARRLETSAA